MQYCYLSMCQLKDLVLLGWYCVNILRFISFVPTLGSYVNSLFLHMKFSTDIPKLDSYLNSLFFEYSTNI